MAEDRGGGRRESAGRVFKEDTNVLHGGDDEVLDLLSPKPAPARAFKAVVVGRIGEALFHQLLAPFAVLPPRLAVGLTARLIEQLLMFMTLDRPAQGRAGALR